MIKTGGEFEEFLRRQNLEEESQNRLIEVSKKILTRTDLLDNKISTNCQLVVGEVQSGKTMSFTALIALAHENGFPVVVVLAGTKNQLLIQTAARLTKDLRADGNGGANPWVMLIKPTKKDRKQNISEIQKALNIWNEKDAPDSFKPTVVISILKHQTSLGEVTEILGSLNSRFNINDFPVLIIDDEGDQASLNLRWVEGEESTIYEAIGKLRQSLKRHSYVMYTATPQGPLLIDIQDALSPDYVTMLHSGPDYLGGKELFIESETFSQTIPEHEFNMIFDINDGAAIPRSLKQSLAYYLLALFLAQNRTYPKPLSMLIHPSATKNVHVAYETWVLSVLGAWEKILREPDEQVYAIEKENFFKPAEDQLRLSAKLPKEWNLDLALLEIRWWISKIDVRVVNSDHNNFKPNEWLSKAGWILIGGNRLERGFTIENLAVTYMPRSTGAGNVDVIQQRGRFFGYKRQYSDLLRGWFFLDQIQAYVAYVEHEQSIRQQLNIVDNNNEKLSTWRRRFLLDPNYRPVRAQVISLGITQKRLSIFKQHMLFDPILAEQHDSFLQRIHTTAGDVSVMPNDGRKGFRNFYAMVEIEDALALLADWPMASENRAELDDMIWALQTLVEDREITQAAIILMDWDEKKNTQYLRERSMLHNRAVPGRSQTKQTIANIFQGETPGDNTSYPGDAAMVIENAITIQVHNVKPIYENSERPAVVALGLILPPNTKGFVVESANPFTRNNS
jgi:hypothetical protein